ncbi:acetylxylan esterase-like protein 1 precursor [Flagelloscypha sp. PMI_526]|nr:acetylxylan esterase-like protein 1 precursor [Flagelloscypha sp. PMI_526]
MLKVFTLAACLLGSVVAGPNPNNVTFWTYVPDGLVKNPSLILALPWCTGTALDFYTYTDYAKEADARKSYLLIYGQAPREGYCWDVASHETLTHDGGGDSLGLASAARYAIRHWGVKKVFATGHSSGGMMSNVMAGSYPDIISAAAPSAGVPFGCFETFNNGGPWNVTCAQGQFIQTGQEWAQRVHEAFPGYRGPYPRMQLWHGTADDVLYYQNFLEEVKMWTTIHGLSETATKTIQDDPVNGTTHTVYGWGQVQGYSVKDGPHNIEIQEPSVLAFFGL